MALDNYQIIVQLLLAFLYSIPTLLFIICSIYFLRKMGSRIDGMLILVGNCIIFLSIVLEKIIWIQFVSYQKWDVDMYSYSTIALSSISAIGSLLFVIGVFLLIRNIITTKKQLEN